jgi:membrane protein
MVRKAIAKAALISSRIPSHGGERKRVERRIWRAVSRSPFELLWNLQGVPAREVAVRTWKAVLSDRVLGQSAELGFYFFFALFPTLFCASSILGMVAKSAHQIYDKILNYLALVVPAQGLKTVLFTFNQTTAAATSGKVTIGSIGTLWAASVAISAIQSSLNSIYKIHDTRSYIVSQLYAVWLTLVLASVISIGLAALFAGNFFAGAAHSYFHSPFLGSAASAVVQILGWAIAAFMLSLCFAIIYFWVPGWKERRWHWLTPGAISGIIGWLITSLGLRLYFQFFTRFSVVYGSLGAVVILLSWFYVCGLMLLLGAEINKEIELAVAEKRAAAESPSTGA